MPKFPIDAPKKKVIKTLESLGFVIVREREHIAMSRLNKDRSITPLTIPNHKKNQGFNSQKYLHPVKNFKR